MKNLIGVSRGREVRSSLGIELLRSKWTINTCCDVINKQDKQHHYKTHNYNIYNVNLYNSYKTCCMHTLIYCIHMHGVRCTSRALFRFCLIIRSHRRLHSTTTFLVLDPLAINHYPIWQYTRQILALCQGERVERGRSCFIAVSVSDC